MTVQTARYGNDVLATKDIDPDTARRLVLFSYANSAATLLIDKDVSLSPPQIVKADDGTLGWRAEGVNNADNGIGGVPLKAIVMKHYESLAVESLPVKES